MVISHLMSSTRLVKKRLHVKKFLMNSIGVNIIKYPQLKMRQLTQHLFFIIKDWKGHQITTQIRSHT